MQCPADFNSKDSLISVAYTPLSFGGEIRQHGGDSVVRGLGDGSPPVGSRGEAPVGGLGDEVP